jgi:hypothetical protein
MEKERIEHEGLQELDYERKLHRNEMDRKEDEF